VTAVTLRQRADAVFEPYPGESKNGAGGEKRPITQQRSKAGTLA